MSDIGATDGVLVFFCLLLHITDLLGDLLQVVLEVRVLNLELCYTLSNCFDVREGMH